MNKQDVKYMAVLLFMAAAILSIGFTLGYIHVIVHSEAYCIDQGDTLVMLIDGHIYQYVVSPEFYDRIALTGYGAPFGR